MIHLALLLALASGATAAGAPHRERPFPLPSTRVEQASPEHWSTDAEDLARDLVRERFEGTRDAGITLVSLGTRLVHEDGTRRIFLADLGVRAGRVDVLDRRARVMLLEMHEGRFRALALAGNLEDRRGSEALGKASRRLAEARVSEMRAIEIIRASTGLPEDATATTEQGLDGPAGGPFRIVWRVRIADPAARVSIEAWVDARSGDVLGIRDARVRASGSGLTFDPNPVQQSQVVWSDQNDSPAAIPAALYTRRTLPRLDGTGRLRGAWADLTPTPASTPEPTLIFDYDRGDSRFEPVAAYFHIDACQQRLQDLGFPALNAEPQRVHAHGTAADSSWYDTIQDLIVLGDGGVDDGEDPDIVLHEYGHAIHYDAGAAGPSFENRALGEGWADYVAATASADPRIGEWDATSYSSAQPLPYLRRVDGNKTYPTDLTGTDEHADGEIWSAALWDLRGALGPAVADPLVDLGMITGGYNPGMPAASQALLAAETILFGGSVRPVVDGVLRNRGLLPGGRLQISDTTPLPGQTITLRFQGSSPGVPYLILPSFLLQATPLGAGATLNIGTDLLGVVLAVPGLLGVTPPAGPVTTGFSFPNAPGWIGTTLFWQAFEWNPWAGGVTSVSNLVPTTVHDKS